MNSSISIPVEVINRYAYKTKISVEKSTLVFDKLANFLESASFKSKIPNKQIDNAWHEFILHTKLYFEYCEKKFGKFIHHIPTSPIECSSDEPSKECSSDEPSKGCSSDAPDKNKADENNCAEFMIECNSDCQSCKSLIIES